MTNQDTKIQLRTYGPNEGKSVILGNTKFTNGKAEIFAKDEALIKRVLCRFYDVCTEAEYSVKKKNYLLLKEKQEAYNNPQPKTPPKPKNSKKNNAPPSNDNKDGEGQNQNPKNNDKNLDNSQNPNNPENNHE